MRQSVNFPRLIEASSNSDMMILIFWFPSTQFKISFGSCILRIPFNLNLKIRNCRWGASNHLRRCPSTRNWQLCFRSANMAAGGSIRMRKGLNLFRAATRQWRLLAISRPWTPFPRLVAVCARARRSADPRSTSESAPDTCRAVKTAGPDPCARRDASGATWWRLAVPKVPNATLGSSTTIVFVTRCKSTSRFVREQL